MTAPSAKDFRDFMLWEQAAQDTIDFKKIYVDMTGDVKAGLLLSQIIYWRLPRKNRSLEDTRLSIQKHDRMWLAKADADWWAEVRLSPKEARAARLIIEERGLITCQTMRFYGNPTTHISINEEAFMEAWAKMIAIPPEERDAGRTEGYKAKRVSTKKPNSKPTSGNRTPRQKAAEAGAGADKGTTERTPADAPIRYRRMTSKESRYYPFRNNGITQRVITGLPKGQKPDYPNGNNPITHSVISLTESPPETPPEISLETSPEKKRGGALHVTGNPRAQEEPAAPVAVLDQPECTTSEKATPSTASVAETADGPLVAGTPDGVTPEGLEVTDEDLEMLFERRDENTTAVEQVPGGAAGEAARPPTIDDLPAVPEAELLERPQAVAGDPVYKAIAALAGGVAKLEVLLAEATRSGGYGRERWLRLNVDEVERVKITAQGQARQPGPDGKRVPFSTLSILGLDRLIGAPKLVGGGQKAAQPAGPYGNATRVTAPGQKLTAPPVEPYTGSTMIGRWVLKANVATVVEVVEMREIEVEGVKQARAVLCDGSMLSIADLVVKHNRLQVGL